MKKIILLAAIFVGVLYFYSQQNTAPAAPGEPPPPPPPPPPPSSDCTPGYWKNHTDIWFGWGCGGAISDADLDDMLSPEDGGLGRVKENRETAASLLNSCAAVTPNCD